MKHIEPSYALGLILLMVVLGAGATAGVSLAGNVVGQSVTSVDQAVTVNATAFDYSDVGVEEAVVTVGNQGAEFAVGAEAFQGDTYGIYVPVQNRASGNVTVELVLSQIEGPDPVSIDAEATGKDEFDDDCQAKYVVQVDKETWRLRLDGDCDDRVKIIISIDSNADPGFYKVSGQIKPLEGIE